MPMPTKVVALVVALLGPLLPSPSVARQWMTTPQILASEYARITDQRSPREAVVVIWMSPLTVDPAAAATIEVLTDYVVLGLIHVSIADNGAWTYFDAPADTALEPSGLPRVSPLDEAALPRHVVLVLRDLRAEIVGQLGTFGAGITWFVYQSKDVGSCRAGGFAVRFAGERYTYETPIPGCP